jgi:hypothetical protein
MAKATAPAAKSGGGITAVQGLVVGAALVGAPSLFLLLAVLLAPGLLCLFAERTPGRPEARASLLAGLAFAVGPAWQLWLAGLGFGHALGLLADPATLARAWCAGGCGWLGCELAPLAIATGLELQSERRRKKLTEQRAGLIKEWNLKSDPPA